MINNLTTIAYMLLILGIAVVVNTILGIVIANKKVEFKWSTMFGGIGKALIIATCMLLFCVTLELVPTILSRVDIEVPSDLITVTEIVTMTLTAYKKYVTDCVDKFKTILGIKEVE